MKNEMAMEQRKNQKEFAQKLENLVGRRFETLQKLNEYLTEYLKAHTPIYLEFTDNNWESDHTPDFNLIGCCETDLVFCDIDIYFLWDRENNLYITEVGYEFD